MSIPVWGLVLTGIGTVATVVGTVYAFQVSQPKDPIIPKTSAFYCAQMPNTSTGGSVWTVMYRKDNEMKPWLRMVRSMGDGWGTQQRCEEIAENMDKYRQDGLVALEYRKDEATPKQFVLCAKTKISGEACPLVVTLKPEDNPYDELRKVAGALVGGYGVDQNSNGSKTPILPIINLEDQLAPADKKL